MKKYCQFIKDAAFILSHALFVPGILFAVIVADILTI